MAMPMASQTADYENVTSNTKNTMQTRTCTGLIVQRMVASDQEVDSGHFSRSYRLVRARQLPRPERGGHCGDPMPWIRRLSRFRVGRAPVAMHRRVHGGHRGGREFSRGHRTTDGVHAQRQIPEHCLNRMSFNLCCDHDESTHWETEREAVRGLAVIQHLEKQLFGIVTTIGTDLEDQDLKLSWRHAKV